MAGTATARGKRRHPPTGGYARGDETRSRIIDAALEIFALHGFGGASTRMIADRASVNLPALQYYFNGKEGVYLACAEYIAGRLADRLGPASDGITKTLARERPSRQRLLQMLQDYLDGLADFFLGERELEKWALFIIREQAQPTKAFDILFDRAMRRILQACTALVAELIERPADDSEVRLRTFALVGQIVCFRTARETALRLLGWPDFEGDRLQIVKGAIREQITRGLGRARTNRRRRTR